jgi:hypothetical protein
MKNLIVLIFACIILQSCGKNPVANFTWSPQNPNGTPIPRWLTTPFGDYRGTQYMYDGSYA